MSFISVVKKYIKTIWFDDIVDPKTGYVIDEGTYFTANRANNIENGIENAFIWLNQHDSDIQRIRVQMELDGRAPGNSGSFADTFDSDPNKLVRQTASATLTAPRSVGTTVLNVDNTEGFVAFTQATIYDGTNSEDVLITAITENTITVQPLVHDYVKGAKVARSNAVIQPDRMIGGNWGTYSITDSGVV